ncbi:wings apart-like protein regulation of heterochromatin-domain-containing protein [Xylaria sp. FL1042]|nr:wings apart-like protein regulation of heterochromatin-domain-containing protein [Xylaria sp. FL1042]
MGAEYERGAQRKKRGVTTYGKAPRKRQPKAVFTPVTASESMSEEDPINASDTIVGSRQLSVVPSPKPKVSSARFKNLDGTRDTRMAHTSSQNSTSSDRKRKVSQIYKSRDRSQPVTDESEKEEPPPAPEPRRSRISQPEDRPSDRERARIQQYAPSEPLSSEAVGLRLSSPPPTPTPPRVSKSVAKSPVQVPRQRVANAPSIKNIQKQPLQRQHQIPLHLARDLPPKVKQSNALSTRVSKEPSQHTLVDKPRGSSLLKKPRKRLIDALAEQESSDATTFEEEDTADTQVTSMQTIFSQSSNTSDFDNQSLLETPKPKTKAAPTTGTRTFTRSSSALKFTYGQGRKVLEEEDDLLESLTLPTDSSYSRRRLDLGGPKKSTSALGAFDYDDDDGGAANNSPSSKLRGIHELRQAGANSRVADAMQDLVDQIGKPGTNSSSRRAALLQVAEKMRDKTFIRQCRDHGVESIMLQDIGKETDIICCYLILSSFVMIIAKGPSSHVGSLLRTEETGPTFARLLNVREDIKKVVKDRKTNLSKRSQNSVIGIENLLRELPIWDGNRPSFISPRSLAIISLQLLIAQDVLIGGDETIFTDDVIEHLFEVLSDSCSNAEYWDFPKTARSVELCGALSILGVRVAAAQGGTGEWILRYLPVIADAFYMSLQKPVHEGKALEDLILKLTINVTNNNLDAPDVFASRGLLPALAASVSNNFNEALTLVSQDAWVDGITDSLVLRLGILINFAEHSELVRQIVNDCHYENREPVKELIRLFIENHRRTSEADSMEKSHLNVAFGYLSILLGYLALHRPVRQKLVSSHSSKSIGPLIGSIREFIAHYEKVENDMSESDDGGRHHGSFAEGLQELVQRLEDKAAHD